VSDQFELRISDVSEIEAIELQNEIEKRTKAPHPVDLTHEPLPNASSSGDPGLAIALLAYAPQVIPVLASAVAAWLVAGRKKKSTSARRLVITRNGIMYADVKVNDMEQEASGKPLETAIEKLLKGAGEDAAGSAAVK
jgi:hypothetical protein